MSRVLRFLGTLLFIGGPLAGITWFILEQEPGTQIFALCINPVVLAIAPIAALFYGEWRMFLLCYGLPAAGWALHEIADRRDRA